MTAESWPEYWKKNKDSGSMTFETVHRTHAGRQYPVEVTANYIRYNRKEYLCAFARDITERKAAEMALKANNRHLAIISSITTTINRSENTSDMLDQVLRDILDLLEVESGAIYIFEADDANEMKLRAAVSRFDEGRIIRYRQSVPAITTLDPGKIYHSESSHFLHEGSGPGTFITVPVNVKDKVIGIIALAAGGGPRQDDTRELLGIGSQLGIALENHRLFSKIQDTSNYLASIINESPDAMLTTDNEGLIASFNRSASRLLIYKPEEVVGKPISTLLPPAAGWSRAARGRAMSASSRARTARWSL